MFLVLLRSLFADVPKEVGPFLLWLAYSGGAAIAFSFIAERWPAFQALSKTAKSTWTLWGSVGIALLAWAILTYVPADLLAQIAPIFNIVYGSVATWMMNQVAHAHDPATIKGRERRPPQV